MGEAPPAERNGCERNHQSEMAKRGNGGNRVLRALEDQKVRVYGASSICIIQRGRWLIPQDFTSGKTNLRGHLMASRDLDRSAN